MELGRKIFFDCATGNVIKTISEMSGDFFETTIEEDIATFTVLSERNRDTFDVIELPYGAHSQDFDECNGFRVNPETKELEFSYPNPNNPEAPQVFVKPLTEQIKELEEKQSLMQTALDDLILGGGAL